MEALISRLFPKFFFPTNKNNPGIIQTLNQNADCNYIHTLSFLSHRELIGGQKTKKRLQDHIAHHHIMGVA